MPVPETMRAVRYHAYGGPEVLHIEEVPVPAVSPRDVLVRVRAVGVNAWDVRARAGHAPQIPGRPPAALPFQPGREAAGEIAAIGEQVGEWSVGDRVVLLASPSCGRCAYCTKRATHLCVARQLPGQSATGTSAEYVVAAADAVAATPANLSDVEALPVVWAYGTALHMLDVAEFRVGDAVVITAAASAMGVACLQLARLAGAGTVIALTRSADKHDALLAAGADAVLDHRDASAPDRLRGLVGAAGVDVVLDNYGSQELLDFGMDVCDLGGRYVLIAAGEAQRFGDTLAVDPLRMIGKHLSLRACRASTRWQQEEALRMAGRRQISMPIAERIPFEDIRRAHALQEAGAHVGKIVVTL